MLLAIALLNIWALALIDRRLDAIEDDLYEVPIVSTPDTLDRGDIACTEAYPC